MMKRFRVVDFFCGAGGFSEGFRIAGHEVIAAFDIWEPAVTTHNGNHPNTKCMKFNVLELANLPDKEFDKVIPDSEVIIGSPPCTDFSNSNNSGKGNKAKGIALIEAYLKIIARKKSKKNSILKYWILENVPKSEPYINESYSFKTLGINKVGNLKVKYSNAGIYEMKYYGVPSSRRRYFCGQFISPQRIIESEDQVISLGNILEALNGEQRLNHQMIKDPNYNFNLDINSLTDHNYVQKLAKFEWEKCKRLKQDRGYMGRMSFPENLEKPSRTIMATMSFSSRESFVLGFKERSFRAPTIREVATLMSFPIDYRFYGDSINTKYKLVGNAVPPKMALAFAKSILLEEGKTVINHYCQLKHNTEIPFNEITKNPPVNKEKRKKKTLKFKYHIPYFKFKSYRVELTNKNSKFDSLQFQWDVEIHYSQGERRKMYTLVNVEQHLNKEYLKKCNSIIKELHSFTLAHDDFQLAYTLTAKERKSYCLIGPFQLLSKVKKELSENFRINNIQTIIQISTSLKLPLQIILGYYVLNKLILMAKKKTKRELTIDKKY